MSLLAGLEAKRQGQIAAAAGHPDWMSKARAVALCLAEFGTFTSDDVVDIVGLPSGSEGANQNNAVGTLFSGLARGKHIEHTGELSQCARTVANASDQRVWQAYTGKVARDKALLEEIEKWMVPLDVTSTGKSTQSKGERYAQQMAAALRKIWGDVE